MNNLKVNITVPNLNVLTPVGTNQYQVVLKFFKNDGTPLNSSFLADMVAVTVTATTTSFFANVPIQDGNYSVNDFTIKAYANTEANCCFAVNSFSFTNSTGTGQNGFTPVISYYGLAEQANLVISGANGSNSENWRVTDNSTYPLDSGKEWWNWIDLNLMKSGSNLNNYVFQSNKPFQFMKIGVIQGTDTLYRWSNPGENTYIEGFSNPNQGQTMSLGTSGAVIRVGFQPI